METYRFSSKVNQREREYLIQTANDAESQSVSTSVYVDGVRSEVVVSPLPMEASDDTVMSLVKHAHGDKRSEIETLLCVFNETVSLGDASAMYSLGTTFFCKGLSSEAIELLEAVIRIEPDHDQALNQLSLSYLVVDRTNDAVSAATAAVRLKPGYADYRNNLGDAFLATGQSVKAIAEFQEAISINMYYADAYFNLSLAHTQHAIDSSDRHNSDQAVARALDCLQKASLLYSNQIEANIFEKAQEALTNGDLPWALKLLKNSKTATLERKRQEQALLSMKFLLDPMNATEETLSKRIRYLSTELDKNPGYPDLQAELGQRHLEHACLIWQKGIECLQKVTKLSGSFTDVATVLDKAVQLHELMKRAAKTSVGKD
ncbi:MAG: hypothetical protein DRP45_00660 [Candidatus Zixiibacteriota bacterium]|nr:MAG: hypothetical protein DRP45_00660 [candidate division Zixibacteria bacterium]